MCKYSCLLLLLLMQLYSFLYSTASPPVPTALAYPDRSFRNWTVWFGFFFYNIGSTRLAQLYIWTSSQKWLVLEKIQPGKETSCGNSSTERHWDQNFTCGFIQIVKNFTKRLFGIKGRRGLGIRLLNGEKRLHNGQLLQYE